MGLINSVDRITRQLEENNKLFSLKEQKRLENESLLNDITIECNSFIYEKLYYDDEDDIILNIDENIGYICETIINKKVEKSVDIIKNDNWVKEKRLVNKYNIYDECLLEDIIREIYYKEYTKLKKQKKLKDQIESKNLEHKLEDYFRKAFGVHKDKKGVYNQLLKYDIKKDIINELADVTTRENDIMLLENIYIKVLNKVKTEYKSDIEIYKSINKQRNSNNYNGVLLFGVASLFGINKSHKYKRR